MAIPKICGIETEYGIMTQGTDESNPISASSKLVNAYVAELDRSGGRVGQPHTADWDFIDESPGNDARQEIDMMSFAPEVETHLANAVLTNGSRFYVDHAHPELSTPECRTPMQALLYDRAGEEILRRAMVESKALLPAGAEIVVYKNNSDGKGQSYGCHENYLVARDLPFAELARHAMLHFVTRSIFCGAGKLGGETPGGFSSDSNYQITQRADFFEERLGLETTLKRPLVNTRDEPHADPKKYRRLHVIIGDANMSETATFLKLATTALWLAAIEDGAAAGAPEFVDPVHAYHGISRDLSLKASWPMVGGSSMSALDIQRWILDTCRSHVAAHGDEALGAHDTELAFELWEHVLSGLETDPGSLADVVDWIAKQRLIEGYRDRHGLDWSNPKLRLLDIQYSDMRPSRGLASRVGLRTLVDPADVERAVFDPPPDTRAWFRGMCLQRFAPQIRAANWDSMIFDVGGASLTRIPMMDPLKGTREQLGVLFEGEPTAAELLKRLAH